MTSDSHQDYDVLVVGGGIIGTSIASSVAVKGMKICLLEKESIGSGSTSRSLGGFRHQFSTEANVRLSRESVGQLKNFKENYGIDPELRFDGYSFIARTEEELGLLKNAVEMQKGFGIEVDLKESSEMEETYPYISFENALGATISYEDGHATTSNVLQGFARKARAHGARILENCEVNSVQQRSDETFVVQTSLSSNTISTSKIVIATGPYARKLGKIFGIDIPVDPLPRQVYVTDRFQGIPARMPLFIDVHNLAAVGREGIGVLMGFEDPNQTKNFKLNFTPDLVEKTLGLGMKLMPVLANASIAYSIEGLYEVTPDSNPIIDQVTENLFCAAGFSGHGFMHSPAVGRIMTELIIDGKSTFDLSQFRLQRFSEGKEHRETLRI